MDFITEWGAIAGIAGLGLGVFLILFKAVMKKKIFPMLTKKQGFQVIIIFMLLVGIITAYSIYIYSIESGIKKEPINDRSDITWNDKKIIYQKMIVVAGKISARSENVPLLEELKLEFTELYEGPMLYAAANDRELLKRMMILNKDYNNALKNRIDFYKPDKLKQSCQKLIIQLKATISKGD